MNARLREALHDLADTQRFSPDPATWERGRRARRRDRAGLVAVALVLVACLGGIATLAPDDRPVAPADGVPDGGAVPSVVHAVPERLVRSTDDGFAWDERVREDDLAIGRASVAFVSSTGSGLPVAVTAADGRPHLLDLPGFVGSHLSAQLPMSDNAHPLALSPDGHQLAWSYGLPAEGREDYDPVPTGVRVADLVTGEVREVDLRAALTQGQAVVPTTIVFSPDSRWIAWQGREMRQWNASGAGSDLPDVAGVIPPDATTSVALPGSRATYRALSVSDTGVVVSLTQAGRGTVWDGAVVRRFRTAGIDVTSTAFASPTGRLVAVGSWQPSRGMAFLDPAAGRVRQRDFSRQVYAGSVRARPLGWLDADTVVALVQPEDDPTYDSTPQLAVMSSPDPDDVRTYRIVARLDPEVAPTTVSVAVDLLPAVGGDSSQALTHDFPEPDWPWSAERKAFGWLLGLLAVAAALVLAARLRRLRP